MSTKDSAAVEAQRTLNACRVCNYVTKHDVVAEVSPDFGSEYNGAIHYQTLRCRGCETYSFRIRDVDYDNAYQTEEDNWHVPESITNYPRVILGHKVPEDVDELPEIVGKIYLQTVRALREGASILAGIGIRATIESICNDRQVKGSNLERRIDGLAKFGWISQRDAERLHAARFLGNDAAHDIIEPTHKNLVTALHIVEHLLRTVYLLDSEMGNLDTVINSVDQFIRLLDELFKNGKAGVQAGDEIPLAKIFGKNMRRFRGGFENLQAQFIAEITTGKYSKLSIGKVGTFANATENVQHFIVM